MIEPIHDIVVIKRKVNDMSSGGIALVNKEPSNIGTILSLGNGRIKEDGRYIPLDVKVGDEILFSKATGCDMNIDGENVTVLRESDILGVFEQ